MTMETVVRMNGHGYINRKDDHLELLRRIEGQARGAAHGGG